MVNHGDVVYFDDLNIESIHLELCFVLARVMWHSVALLQLDTESVSGVFSGA